MMASNSGVGSSPRPGEPEVGDLIDFDSFDPNWIFSQDGDASFEFRTRAAPRGLGSQKSVIWSIREFRPKLDSQPEL